MDTYEALIQRFDAFYQELSLSSLSDLGDIYDDEIEFCDPVQEIKGLGSLHQYFMRTLTHCEYCRFAIGQVVYALPHVHVHWHMSFRHPQLNKGHEIVVPGVSHLCLRDKIYYQRDYYDLGAMLYEHTPILRRIIRYIKSRLIQPLT